MRLDTDDYDFGASPAGILRMEGSLYLWGPILQHLSLALWIWGIVAVAVVG